MDPRRVGEVSRVSVLGGDGEDLAAGAEEGPLAVGGDFVVRDARGDVGDPAPGRNLVVLDENRNAFRFLRGQIEAVDESAVLEDDRRRAERRELDVEIGEARQGPRFFGLHVVSIEIHPLVLVAVGEEVNRLSAPHREDIPSLVGRDVFGLFRLEIINPDVVGHPAPVPLPGPEFAEDAVVGQLRVVRGKGTEASARQGKRDGGAALGRNDIELSDEIVPFPHPAAENDAPAVGPPAHNDVIRAMRSDTSSRPRVAV